MRVNKAKHSDFFFKLHELKERIDVYNQVFRSKVPRYLRGDTLKVTYIINFYRECMTRNKKLKLRWNRIKRLLMNLILEIVLKNIPDNKGDKAKQWESLIHLISKTKILCIVCRSYQKCQILMLLESNHLPKKIWWNYNLFKSKKKMKIK